MIKNYNRIRYREKFRRYRIFYVLMAVVFLAGLFGELFWLGSAGYCYDLSETSFSSFFSDLFAGELIVIVAVFLFGVTLYAPLFGFVSAALRGAFSGFCLSVLCAQGTKSAWIIVISFLYLVLSAWLFLAYATFCTTTALQIFSAPSKSAAGGERKMYGGTLFYSAFSRGSVNPRFLLSYCLIFFCAVFFSFLMTLAFSGARCLF
ncbi:MAG: hypothetical protein IKD18_01310 [Clostridia bacterium]|nr:hypothetical protein [Clostridia bacterium]